jgi:hypothetical protein
MLTNGGEKIALYSDYETEMEPDVGICLGSRTSKLKLLFEAPKEVLIRLKRSLRS